MNCSHTTGERLASSVASHVSVSLALGLLKGLEVSAAGGGEHQGLMGGKWVATVGVFFLLHGPLRPERSARFGRLGGGGGGGVK